ncbi:iron-containing alcohol dehydrogenase [Clostridia bacterium]|nr:iron-containing alcohol dehydrogenase [Clostridia bacterium]
MERNYAALVMSKFVVGRGSLDYLGSFKNKRVSVIHGGPNILTDLLRSRIESLISKNSGTCMFTKPVLREPFFKDILSIEKEIQDYQPDLIVALGGGAVMDTAKVVQMLYENPGISQEELVRPYQIPDLGKKAILLAIPTTSGTGSETTSAAVFTDDETKEKRLMLGNGLIPQYAILDADFTDSLPASIAAYTGIDALTHALEAAVCTIANPMVKTMAISAAVDLFENLTNSVCKGIAPELKAKAREKCHIAASMAGVAITNSCTGLAHGLDQPGPYFSLPHGQTCGVLLPYTMAFTGVDPSYVTIARRLGLPGSSDEELCLSLVSHIRNLTTDLGIPKSFKEMEISEQEYMDQLEHFANLAAPAMATRLAPRIPNHQETKKILEMAYYA